MQRQTYPTLMDLEPQVREYGYVKLQSKEAAHDPAGHDHDDGNSRAAFHFRCYSPTKENKLRNRLEIGLIALVFLLARPCSLRTTQASFPQSHGSERSGSYQTHRSRSPRPKRTSTLSAPPIPTVCSVCIPDQMDRIRSRLWPPASRKRYATAFPFASARTLTWR